MPPCSFSFLCFCFVSFTSKIRTCMNCHTWSPVFETNVFRKQQCLFGLMFYVLENTNSEIGMFTCVLASIGQLD